MRTIWIDESLKHPENIVSTTLNHTCSICYQRIPVREFFAHCSHLGNCLFCAQEHMLKAIDQEKFPTCLAQEGCSAEMRIDNRSIYEYFSPESKKQWQIYQEKSQTESVQKELSFSLEKKPCQKQDCPGFIIFNQCSKCLTFYCEKCCNLDHEICVGCHKSDIPLPDKIKIQYCPKCQLPFSKEEGCNHIICGNRNCKFEFCEICRETWNFSHHTCKEVRATQETNTTADSNQITEKKQKMECCEIF